MTAKIKLNATSGGGSVALQSPASTTNDANLEFKLPVADGSNGQFMKTDGSGNLSFASITIPAQKIRQFVYKKDGVTTSSNSGSYNDTTESGLNVDITPTASDSILVVQMHSVGGNTNSGRSFFLRMRRKINNTGDVTVGTYQIGDGNNGGMQSLAMTVVDVENNPGWNTSHVINYRMRFGQDGEGTARFDYTTNSILYVLEIAP
jgi:hypothetical protein|tara:strand:- start:129 stop:743 length:615 start_codon:yes stop_codon:yes gene_type:complete